MKGRINGNRTDQVQAYGAGKNQIHGAGKDLTDAGTQDAAQWQPVKDFCTEMHDKGCLTNDCKNLPEQDQQAGRDAQQECLNSVNRDIAGATAAQTDNLNAANAGNQTSESSDDQVKPEKVIVDNSPREYRVLPLSGAHLILQP